MMSQLDKWIDNKVLQNVTTWVFLYFLFLLIIQTDHLYRDSLLILLFIMPVVYINNLYILPLFYKNKIGLGILAMLINMAVFTMLAVYFLSDNLSQIEPRMFFNMFGASILILAFASTFKMARDSFERRQNAKEAELKLLKGQLNPHFLFNTLNNLYGLSVIKSEKLPTLMLQLSDLLRYSLYETKAEFVPLEKEIQYLKSYISLERIRMEDKAQVAFETDVNASINIPPMLLIVFVENAFKYLGLVTQKNEEVNIALKTENNHLEFICRNSIGESNSLPDTKNGGIGLANVKKRLKLLYPNKHVLSIKNDGTYFEINLKLET